MQSFGKYLKALRKKKGLTQIYVAKELNLSLDSYRQMEYREGNPRLDTILKILKTHNASIEELFPDLSIKTENLSSLEKKLISKFAHLSIEQQNAVVTLIDSFVE